MILLWLECMFVVSCSDLNGVLVVEFILFSIGDWLSSSWLIDGLFVV